MNKHVMKSVHKNIMLFSFLYLFATNSTMAQNKTDEQRLLRHIVVVTFKPGTSNAQMQAVDNSFKNLSKLKMVNGYEWGIGSDDRDTQHVKHVYVTTFKSKEDETSYGKSPEHQAHIKLGADYIEGVNATDYFISK